VNDLAADHLDEDVLVAAASSSARFRARSNAGSVRANSGLLACSMGLGFIASRPSLAGPGRASELSYSTQASTNPL